MIFANARLRPIRRPKTVKLRGPDTLNLTAVECVACQSFKKSGKIDGPRLLSGVITLQIGEGRCYHLLELFDVGGHCDCGRPVDIFEPQLQAGQRRPQVVGDGGKSARPLVIKRLMRAACH